MKEFSKYVGLDTHKDTIAAGQSGLKALEIRNNMRY